MYPLTCDKEEGASVWCVGAVKPPSARAIWLLPSAPPPSPALPLAAHRLSSPQPHPKIQKCHLTTTSSHHLSPCMSTVWVLYPTPTLYLPFLGEQLASKAAQ